MIKKKSKETKAKYNVEVTAETDGSVDDSEDELIDPPDKADIHDSLAQSAGLLPRTLQCGLTSLRRLRHGKNNKICRGNAMQDIGRPL